MILVNSRNLGNLINLNRKSSEDIILFLDMEPDYRQMNFTKIHKDTINIHYKKISILLNFLKKKLKKKSYCINSSTS